MLKSNVKSLIGKLNETCRRALESAAGLCLSQTHYEVDIEHFLIKLLEMPDTDIQKILRHFEINETRLVNELTRTMEGFKRGNARTPALSPRVPKMAQDAWIIASIDFKAPVVRSGHIILALMSVDEMARMLNSSSGEFKKISVETLSQNLSDIISGSSEDHEIQTAGAGLTSPAGIPVKGTKALDQFTINLTEKARKGEIDPVLGRDFEIRQMIDILIRRRQNNPILTGEAGVGKTAVVEGFALRIAQGDVPPPLRNVAVQTLDLGLLQAGAGIKGEFEGRLKSIIEEVKASPVPIVLFIDEAHTLIGAGGAAGSGDAANLLKPALARGELRTIAATTWAEYKKHIEKDPALTRRFQAVQIAEPSEERAVQMLRAICSTLERHHRVQVLDEALEAAVKLSHRYVPARQLPDKAVSLIDTACARVAVSQHATPAEVDACRREIEALETELEIIGREEDVGVDARERGKAANGKLAAERDRLAGLEERWKREKELVEKILGLRTELRGASRVERVEGTASAAGEPASPDPAARAKQLDELRALQTELAAVPGGGGGKYSPAASRPRGRGWRPRESRSGCSSSPAPRAWARRRQPSRWPRHC